jgi:DDE superfamily endonuclease
MVRQQEYNDSHTVVRLIVASVIRSAAGKRKKRGYRGKPRVRKRVSMLEICKQLGPAYFKWSYRMSYESFCKLSNLLSYAINRMSRKKRDGSDPTFVRTGPNGAIPPSVQLGIALRYCAGGSSYDIMTSLGVGRADIFRSLWFVVEAIKKCAVLAIHYPKDHDKQRAIAIVFQAKSAADFDCCAGALDGLLIWVNRPSLVDAAKSGVGPTKFFCGRKHKFGLNMQGIGDARGSFLDVSIVFPGSTSDVLAFEGGSIYKKLKDGLLAPGLYWIFLLCCHQF